MSNAPAHENVLVAWLTERFRSPTDRVPLGIGDDMAAVRMDGTLVAVTADMLLDGVHFDSRRQDYGSIGRKAIACSLSDCAAMACEPRGATVSIALRQGMTLDEVKRLYEGMAVVCDEYRCPIIGGDTTSWAGGLAIDVAMLGEPMAARGPILRSGARPGDTIFVSGPLGGSILGSHLSFTPRLDLARQLAGQPQVHAMMDLSDGLSLDLYRLCCASRCDAELDESRLRGVVSAAAIELSRRDGRPPLDHALSDGEDFELLVTGEATLADVELGLAAVGRVLERQASTSTIWLVGSDARKPLAPQGFEHRM